MIRHFLRQLLRRALGMREWFRELGCSEREMRGTRLLREWLSPKQLVQFNQHRYFDVIGCHSGKRYRIRHGTERNIWELDRDGHPRLAQKIGLETDERRALAIAKSLTPKWH
jgi:hypothetical protein